jgi:fructoselysine-6-P-deglycase FrlB-like protein
VRDNPVGCATCLTGCPVHDVLDPLPGSPSLTEREIADQPAAWERAAALAPAVDLFPAGARVALIGCGSSWSAAAAVAALREELGLGETDAFPASEAPLDRAYDRIVAVSRSGTTSEVLHALGRVRPGTRTMAIVGAPESPVAEACQDVLSLGFADDQSVVQTRFVTATIALARAVLGHDLGPVIDDGRAALEQPLPAAWDRRHHVILGRGWCAGLAGAAALMLRETAQATCESYPAMEYRHGPIALAGPHTAVWFLGAAPAGLEEEVDRTGAAVIRSDLDPLAQLVRVQRVAVALAGTRGLDPDRPPHLSRSIVLEGMQADGVG